MTWKAILSAPQHALPGYLRFARPRSLVILVAVVVLLTLAAMRVVIDRQERREFLQIDADLILDDSRLAPKTLSQGRDVFVANCAGCHGAEGRGSSATGTPDLTDQDFLYGTGRASELEQIVLHGIRSGDPKGWDLAWMPAYGTPLPYAREKLPSLSPGEIDQLTSYLLAMNGAIGEDPAAVAAGGSLFQGHGGCWDCHGRDAQGDAAIGAPNLVDRRWLRGDGSRRDISRVIREGSPWSQSRLSRAPRSHECQARRRLRRIAARPTG